MLHDTVLVLAPASGNAIEYRWANSLVEIRNVIASSIVDRGSGTRGTVDHAWTSPDASAFVDLAADDVHLTAAAANAIDQGIADADSGLDLDGEPHDRGAPDLGADER